MNATILAAAVTAGLAVTTAAPSAPTAGARVAAPTTATVASRPAAVKPAVRPRPVRQTLQVKVSGCRLAATVSTAVNPGTRLRSVRLVITAGPRRGVLLSRSGRAVARGGRSSVNRAVTPGWYTLSGQYRAEGGTWRSGAVVRRQVTVGCATEQLRATRLPAATTSPANLTYFWGHLDPTVPVTTVARTTRRFVLHQGALDTKAALQAAGARGSFLQYIRSEAIMDDNGVKPWPNQVAFKPGDWQDISTNHPDWFLRDRDGRRLSPDPTDPNESHFWMMDPANPGWRAFFLGRVREMQAAGGWSGLLLDNVELSLAKRSRAGQDLPAYPTDQAYEDAVNGYLAFVAAGFHPDARHALMANLIVERAPVDGSWERAQSHLTGVMTEAFAVGWNDALLPSSAEWTAEMAELEQTVRSGRSLMAVSQGSQPNTTRQRIAYASYLLVANDLATFRYADYRQYDTPWNYPEYALKLGTPVGPRRLVGTTWVRDYTGGRVSVDPTTWAVSIVTGR